MSLSREELLDKVVFLIIGSLLGHHALHPFSSASLHPVFTGSRPLDVTAVTQGHDHAVVGN